MQAALRQIEDEGGEAVPDELLRHLSPARFEHVNRYGRYHFEKMGALGWLFKDKDDSGAL